MMGMGMGVGFSSPPPWTPAAVPGCILYGGAYLEARATRAAQPVSTNSDFAAWSGVAPAQTPDTWTASNPGTAANHLESNGNACRIISDYTAFVGVSRTCIAGNRYAAGLRVLSIAGQIRDTDDIGAPVLAPGTFSREFTAATASSTGWKRSAAVVDATITDATFANLSLQSYTPAYTTIPGSVLAQATATAQPWAGALGMMFDGDLMPWNAAASNAKCLHDGNGGSVGFAYRPTTLKAENRIIATAATAVGNVGVCVSCTNANTVRVRVMNGGGAYDYDSGDVACAIAVNNTYAMVLRVASGAGGVSLRVNGTEVISGALTAPSAANPTTGLMLGGDAVGAATNVTGYVGQAWVVQRAVTVAECAQYEAYVAAGGL